MDETGNKNQMIQNPLGYLIQAQGLGGSERAALLTHLSKSNPRSVSVLDDFGLCIEIKNRLPDCTVIHRSSTYEPVPAPNATAGLLDMLDGIKSQDKRIVIMVNCENGYSVDHVNMWLDMIIAVHEKGWRLCVGNVSSGSVKSGQGSDPNNWIQAIPLFKVMASHPGHYLGFHDYSHGFAWAVSNGEWGDPRNPPNAIDWTKPQWHIGRNIQGIKAACEPVNCPIPQMIVTEGVIDNMGDVEQHFGFKSDGYKTLTGKYMDWYPNKNIGDVLADCHIWAWEKVYAQFPFVVGLHIYCWGDASTVDKWKNYRVDDNARYLKRMEGYIAPDSTPPVTPPAPQYPAFPADFDDRAITGDFRIVASPALNVRSNPTQNSALVGSLPQGIVNDVEYISADRLRDSERYENDFGGIVGVWIPIRFIDAKSRVVEGWTFSGYMALEPKSPPPVETKHAVTIRIGGLTREQAQTLVHNVMIQIEEET